MFVWVCILAVLGPTLAQNARRVELTQGPVVGYEDTTYNGVFSFYGIPYATAPTGRDKFKAPLPAPNWTEPLEATNDKIICPQYYTNLLDDKNPSEDCLVANVFVPNTTETNLPVLVHIHGGGFLIGYSNWEKPRQFVQSKHVIAITFNYRLGPHGFLCIGTENIPGNAGMKDQVAALRWVKENIASFGGNPENITLAGCSAGGGSVDLHMLSKITKGLFKHVIGQSGANVASFVVQTDPIENAKYYASNINFTGDAFEAMEEFYLTISMDQLWGYSLLANKDHAVKMSPCIERDVGVEMFLDDTPKNIITSGNFVRYPMIYGYADMEGLFRIGEFEYWKDEMNRNFTQFIPPDLKFESAEEKEKMAQEIKQFYFGDKAVSNETILKYVDFLSDVIFVYPMQKAVTLQVEAGNNEVYLHVYSFTDDQTPYVPYTTVRGADHCAQSYAVFDDDYTRITPEYKAMKDKMREIWFDFMTTGNPTPPGSSIPTWTPARADRAPCMNLGKTIQMQEMYAKERTEFWDKIYNKHFRQPVPPSVPSSSASFSPILGISIFVVVQFVSVLM
ncbi:hypothetical protein ABMA28_010265 [Loxostege sticticalis]|uniref:Carboxylic ester hydrolase n=1 Tax=Loxostege sticticalis TaxID=481309 RepID=A0ABD0SA81_LOXSC